MYENTVYIHGGTGSSVTGLHALVLPARQVLAAGQPAREVLLVARDGLPHLEHTE